MARHLLECLFLLFLCTFVHAREISVALDVSADLNQFAGAVVQEINNVLNTNAAPQTWDNKMEAIPTIKPIKVAPIFTKPQLTFNVVNGYAPQQQVCLSVAQAPVDVYFLADNTGSMYSYIMAVKTAASTIYTQLKAMLPNVWFGVGAYRDHVADGAGNFTNIASIQATTQAAFNGFVNSWAASGGGDWPEDQLWALHKLATTAGWRSNSIKIIVWFGDAPARDPSGGPSVSPTYVTLTQTSTALQAAGIRVIALDNMYLNYYGQASAIASATGGQYYPGVGSASIAATLVSSLAAVPVTLQAVVQCPINSPITVHVHPPVATATFQNPACFDISVHTCTDTECFGGKFKCSVRWLNTANGQQVGATYTINVNVVGSDTTAPLLAPPVTTPVVHLQCPQKPRWQEMTAVDNCDSDVPVAFSTSSAVGNSCSWSQTGTWTATDDTGNTATATQTQVVSDSLPPVFDPACKGATLCAKQTYDASTVCFDASLWRKCFKDECQEKLSVSVDCGKCKQMFEEPVPAAGLPGMTALCETVSSADGTVSADGTKVCFKIKGWPRDRACCDLVTTATDACGNSVTVAIPKFCILGKGASDQGCNEMVGVSPWKA